MSENDRQRWERKHETPSVPIPRSSVLLLLDALAPPARGAVALDLACGQGRHCATLGARGYRVVAADIARTALIRVRANVGRACTDGTGAAQPLALVQFDSDCWPFAVGAFDLILQTDFLDRRILPAIRVGTKIGGHVIVETFVRSAHGSSGGPSNPAYILEPGELSRTFSDWHIVRPETVDPCESRASIVVRRPST